MKINFNTPKISEFFMNKSKDAKFVSGKIAQGKNAPFNSEKSIKEEDILTYFAHHFKGQANYFYKLKSNMPVAELDINLSIQAIYQTTKNEYIDFRSQKDFFNKEKTATRLYEMAIDIAQEDTKKISSIKNTIQKAFIITQKEIGNLPEISHKTLQLALDKIDTHVNNKKAASIDILV